MITLKNREITQLHQVLIALKHPFKWALMWKIETIVAALRPLNERVSAKLAEIQDKYADKDEKGEFLLGVDGNGNPVPGTFRVTSNEKVQAYNDALTELFDIENELPVKRLNFDEFPDDFTPSLDVVQTLKLIITPPAITDTEE